MLDNDIIMSYKEDKQAEMSFDDDFNISSTGNFSYTYIIYCKNLYTSRVKPKAIIYHCSPIENRESILKNGLIPRESKDSKIWSKELDLEYPPAIFAINDSDSGWYFQSKVDVWGIDTTKIPNKWWEDLNATNVVNSKCIMTFEAIPAMYLKLLT